MPPSSFLYAIPYEFYKRYWHPQIWLFHGTSHKYVAEATSTHICGTIVNLRLITCHLGSRQYCRD